MIYYCNLKNKIAEMSLSKSSLKKIDSCGAIELEDFITQETNIRDNAPLTETAYIIENVRTPPRAGASFGEILSFLNIN